MTVDWTRVAHDLDQCGWAVLPAIIDRAACGVTAALFGPGETFRSHVVMARYGFGKGEYRYFAYPLPALVHTLRDELYPALSRIANRWHERMGMESRFPADHAAFLARCHAA